MAAGVPTKAGDDRFQEIFRRPSAIGLERRYPSFGNLVLETYRVQPSTSATKVEVLDLVGAVFTSTSVTRLTARRTSGSRALQQTFQMYERITDDNVPDTDAVYPAVLYHGGLLRLHPDEQYPRSSRHWHFRPRCELPGAVP